MENKNMSDDQRATIWLVYYGVETTPVAIFLSKSDAEVFADGYNSCHLASIDMPKHLMTTVIAGINERVQHENM